MHIMRLDSVTSTNDYAMELLRTGDVESWTVVSARNQTDGRGQRSNRWISDPGDNLTFSIMFRPTDLPEGSQFRLAKLVCLGIADALDELHIEVRIKWPNDIYVEGKKLAGVLIQTRGAGLQVHWAVAGIGINVNQTDFPLLPVPAVSLKHLCGRPLELEPLLQQVVSHIRRRYDQACSQPHRLDTDYLDKLYRHNVWAHYLVDGKRIVGKITGVDAAGWLVMIDPEGNTHTYRFKEVSYVP